MTLKPKAFYFQQTLKKPITFCCEKDIFYVMGRNFDRFWWSVPEYFSTMLFKLNDF